MLLAYLDLQLRLNIIVCNQSNIMTLLLNFIKMYQRTNIMILKEEIITALGCDIFIMSVRVIGVVYDDCLVLLVLLAVVVVE